MDLNSWTFDFSHIYFLSCLLSLFSSACRKFAAFALLARDFPTQSAPDANIKLCWATSIPRITIFTIKSMPPRIAIREYLYAKGGLRVANISDKGNEIHRYSAGDKNVCRKKVNVCRSIFTTSSTQWAQQEFSNIFFFYYIRQFGRFFPLIGTARPRKCNTHWTASKIYSNSICF